MPFWYSGRSAGTWMELSPMSIWHMFLIMLLLDMLVNEDRVLHTFARELHMVDERIMDVANAHGAVISR